MITAGEVMSFWCEWVIIRIVYFFVIILALPLFPIAYLIRYQFDVKKNNPLWWVLNDESEFGEQWWLDKKGLTAGVESAFMWFSRRPAWNFFRQFRPKWRGKVTDLKQVRCTLKSAKHPLSWANKYDYQYGVNHVYYRVEGTVYGRFSYASPNVEFQIGTDEKSYLLKLKF